MTNASLSATGGLHPVFRKYVLLYYHIIFSHLLNQNLLYDSTLVSLLHPHLIHE